MKKSHLTKKPFATYSTSTLRNNLQCETLDSTLLPALFFKKALALSSRPVFVVCDKEKVQIMSGKRIIKMERRFGFSPFLKSGNFRRVGKLLKNSSIFYSRKLSH